MTIFAITTNVEFINRNEWLFDFFNKYNKTGYELHTTLKQPCIILETDIDNIKNILAQYISTNQAQQINIAFNKLSIEDSETDLASGNGCIMIEASNPDINKLQSGLIHDLAAYQNYLVPKTKSYEENFKPHITIAANLFKEEFELAKQDLIRDILIQGKITEINLIIIRNFDPKLQLQKREIIKYKLVQKSK